MKWILTYVIVGSEGYMTDIRNHITQRASLSQGSLQHLKDYVIGAGHNVIGLCETPFIIPLIIVASPSKYLAYVTIYFIIGFHYCYFDWQFQRIISGKLVIKTCIIGLNFWKKN